MSTTASKPKPKKYTIKEQSERFKETARQIGCDTSPGALDRAFGKIDATKPQSPKNPRL